MSKTNRNLGAVLAVLLLGLLIAGLVYVVATVYKEPVPTEEQGPGNSEQTAPSASETEVITEKRIAVFQTGDIHGFLMDATSGDTNDFQYRLAYMAKDFSKARESGDYDDVLLVDSGNIYQGTPVSDLTGGAAIRAALDIMDYDAVTLGAQDFYGDIVQIASDTQCTLPEYQIGDFEGDPDIPVIAANLYYSNNHQRAIFTTKDYVVVEKAGCRIALIGYISDYSDSISDDDFKDYEIRADLTEFSQRVKEINEAEKPDATIVVAHEDPVIVADALNHEDVDLVTGGYQPDGICGVSESGIPYVQCDRNAQGYSGATLVIDSKGNVRVENQKNVSLLEYPGLLYDTLANSDYLDADILALSDTAWDAISESMNEALGYIDSSIERTGYISGPTTTGGNFITGLMLEYARDSGVVAAFTNRDGFCKDILVPDTGTPEVSISVGDIYAMNPYNYSWLTYELTGEELAQLLADGLTLSDYGDQVSGLTFEYNNLGTVDDPDIEIVSITLSNGRSVDVHGQDTVYKICITGNCAFVEGSVFEGKAPLVAVPDAPVDNRSLISVLRKRRDKGDIHIPTDTSDRSVCLNADEVQGTEPQTTEMTDTGTETA